MAIMDMVKKAGDAASSAKESVAGKTRELAAKSLQELQHLEPLLKNCGLIIGDVSMTISVPPAVACIVEQTDSGSATLEDLAKDNELTKTQAAIVSGLQKAFQMDSLVADKGYTIGQVEVVISVPPSVTVHLNSRSSRAFSSEAK